MPDFLLFCCYFCILELCEKVHELLRIFFFYLGDFFYCEIVLSVFGFPVSPCRASCMCSTMKLHPRTCKITFFLLVMFALKSAVWYWYRHSDFSFDCGEPRTLPNSWFFHLRSSARVQTQVASASLPTKPSQCPKRGTVTGAVVESAPPSAQVCLPPQLPWRLSAALLVSLHLILMCFIGFFFVSLAFVMLNFLNL